METVESVVAHNVRQLREARRFTVRSLSARLGELGHPILPSGITKIEDGKRRVDVGDLVALAVALGVNPNRLLLPASSSGEVALTPAVEVGVGPAWAWARGKAPLLNAAAVVGPDPDPTVGELQDDFRRHSLPAHERLREDHPAIRAAQDVMDGLMAVLERIENPDRFGEGAKPLWANPYTSAGVRANLKRLIAEVEALTGGDDGR